LIGGFSVFIFLCYTYRTVQAEEPMAVQGDDRNISLDRKGCISIPFYFLSFNISP